MRAFLLILFLVVGLKGCAGISAPASSDAVTPSEAPAPPAADVTEPGPAAEEASSQPSAEAPTNEASEAQSAKALRLYIDGQEVSVDWEASETVDALIEIVSSDPLTVQASAYGGFEQVGPLGTELPRNDVQTTTQPGDIVLYSGNQLVVFYGSNSWSYTRLGRITGRSAAELSALLDADAAVFTLVWE